MAYIGKPPAQIKRDFAEKDTFTGDGSTTTFDLTNIASSANTIQVFVDNVRQEPGSGKSYTLGEDGSGDLKRITFSAAPDASAEIYVINPGTRNSVLNTVSCGAIDTGKLGTDAVTGAKLADDAVDSEHLTDGSVDNVHLAGSIADSKLSTITTASKVNVSALSAPGSTSLFLRGDRSYAAIPTDQIDNNAFNISLLGFKMAVNEGLTVFNLVDGVVDEFHDESGTDEGEGSNDLYNCSSDYYINSTTPDGSATPGSPYSAGFTTTAVTEGDTSVAGTNPAVGEGTLGTFTVPTGMTAAALKVWGAGGGVGGHHNTPGLGAGGGGGFVSGTLAVTPGQVLYVGVAEGGSGGGDAQPYNPEGGVFGLHPDDPNGEMGGGCAGGGGKGGGGGLIINQANVSEPSAVTAPGVYMAAGSGGGGGADGGSCGQRQGGAGGGLTGQAGVGPKAGPGGSQTAGGDGNFEGGFLYGGKGSGGGGAGGGGYYGGSGSGGSGGSGSGGSSYHGHPQITSGATEGGNESSGGGTADPQYVSSTNEASGAMPGTSQGTPGEDGYVLITGTSAPISASATSTTIISNAFTSTSVPTTSRIVVFEENVDTPTLNTDIIASISRDGGSNFTTATLTDSGYVTGSSGQRILTGQATISGQPSGQSLRWKLALANNQVKIHGVSLQWA